MFRMVFIVAGLAIWTQTAKCEESSKSDFDVLTIKPMFIEPTWRIFNRIETKTIFTRISNTERVSSESSYSPSLNLTVAQNKTDWSVNARKQIILDSEQTSLIPIMRFESKDGRLDIKLRRQSLWAVWRKAFP
jgi:hypothetical protein